MSYIERLITVVDCYCEATGLTREQVSYQIFRDQRRLGRVADGSASMTVRSFEEALDWLSMKWPQGAAWPDVIERPPFKVEA